MYEATVPSVLATIISPLVTLVECYGQMIYRLITIVHQHLLFDESASLNSSYRNHHWFFLLVIIIVVLCAVKPRYHLPVTSPHKGLVVLKGFNPHLCVNLKISINSVAPGRCEGNFTMNVSSSTLVQVRAWCHQTTSHYISQTDPNICCQMASLSHNELTWSHGPAICVYGLN